MRCAKDIVHEKIYRFLAACPGLATMLELHDRIFGWRNKPPFHGWSAMAGQMLLNY